MRTKRIELEGSAGHVAIERERSSRTVRVDSIIRDPKRCQQAWKVWELDAAISEEDLVKIAIEVQLRTDGVRGTGSDIDGYYRELQRFVD